LQEPGEGEAESFELAEADELSSELPDDDR
jgi:hypothetical protein